MTRSSRAFRRSRVAQAAMVLAAGLAAAVVGQMVHGAHGAASDPDYPPPYDSSKADQALKVYSEHHPECLLWSDWHKLCSHTGPHGSAFCRTDSEHAVAPSHPFCAEWDAHASAADVRQRGQERSSFQRFELPTGKRFAAIFKTDRPFNGSSVQEMENPSCLVWGTDKADLCSEVSDRNLPLCRSTHIKLNSMQFPLVCKKFRPGIVCTDDNYIRSVDSNTRQPNADDHYVPPTLLLYGRPLFARPVVGLSCAR